MTNPLQEGGDDKRRPRQGPIARAMVRHIEDQEESKALVDVQIVTTLSLCDNFAKFVKIVLINFPCKINLRHIRVRRRLRLVLAW